jgi:hypothetical protein
MSDLGEVVHAKLSDAGLIDETRNRLKELESIYDRVAIWHRSYTLEMISIIKKLLEILESNVGTDAKIRDEDIPKDES